MPYQCKCGQEFPTHEHRAIHSITCNIYNESEKGRWEPEAKEMDDIDMVHANWRTMSTEEVYLREIDALRVRLAEAENERENSWAITGGLMEAMQQRVESWQGKCADAEAKVAELETRLAEAERKLAESAEHQDTTPHIGCTCALCATINKLEEAETDRQSGMEEVGSVQTKIDMLRSSLQDLVSAMHIYQQEVDYDFPPPHQRDAIRRAERTLKSTE